MKGGLAVLLVLAGSGCSLVFAPDDPSGPGVDDGGVVPDGDLARQCSDSNAPFGSVVTLQISSFPSDLVANTISYPTLDESGHKMVFLGMSSVAGVIGLWETSRSVLEPGALWEQPEFIDEIGQANQPKLANEGNTLWFTQSGSLFRSTFDGSWSAPQMGNLTDLPAALSLVGAPMQRGDRVVVSGREAGSSFDVYECRVDVEKLSDCVVVGATTAANTTDREPWLSSDGLRLYFVRSDTSDMSLFWARRPTLNDEFVIQSELALPPEVQGVFGTPWLSESECEVYFAEVTVGGSGLVAELRVAFR